jgi:hypothetical protein
LAWAKKEDESGELRNKHGGAKKCEYNSASEPEQKTQLIRYRCNGEIILKFILVERIWRYGLDSSGSGYGPVTHSFDYGDELPGSTR